MFTFLDTREKSNDFYCLIIAPHYCVENSNEEETEVRYAVSFGPNLTIEKIGKAFAPPFQEGAYVYGLHEVEVLKMNNVRIADIWLTSYPAVETELFDIKKKAEEILNNKGIETLLERDIKRGYCFGPVRKRKIENPQFVY